MDAKFVYYDWIVCFLRDTAEMYASNSCSCMIKVDEVGYRNLVGNLYLINQNIPFNFLSHNLFSLFLSIIDCNFDFNKSDFKVIGEYIYRELLYQGCLLEERDIDEKLIMASRLLKLYIRKNINIKCDVFSSFDKTYFNFFYSWIVRNGDNRYIHEDVNFQYIVSTGQFALAYFMKFNNLLIVHQNTYCGKSLTSAQVRVNWDELSNALMYYKIRRPKDVHLSNDLCIICFLTEFYCSVTSNNKGSIELSSINKKDSKLCCNEYKIYQNAVHVCNDIYNATGKPYEQNLLKIGDSVSSERKESNTKDTKTSYSEYSHKRHQEEGKVTNKTTKDKISGNVKVTSLSIQPVNTTPSRNTWENAKKEKSDRISTVNDIIDVDHDDIYIDGVMENIRRRGRTKNKEIKSFDDDERFKIKPSSFFKSISDDEEYEDLRYVSDMKIYDTKPFIIPQIYQPQKHNILICDVKESARNKQDYYIQERIETSKEQRREMIKVNDNNILDGNSICSAKREAEKHISDNYSPASSRTVENSNLEVLEGLDSSQIDSEHI